MTLNNNTASHSDHRVVPEKRHKVLLFLVFVVSFSNALIAQTASAQNSEKTNGWALNKNDQSDETRESEPVNQIEAKAADGVPTGQELSADVDANIESANDELLENASSEVSEISEVPLAESQPTEPLEAAGDNSEGVNQDSDETLIVYDITQGAEPIVPPVTNIQPVTPLSNEQREALATQFDQIQLLKETEDAFSERLGESYLSYGRVLMQAGRTEEARKMFVNALHITKINNGVNSIEQRPILRELFEMNFAMSNFEETEDNLQRIIWLEKKVPENRDNYSYDLVVRLGNFFLDQYLSEPVISELSLVRLNKSTKYLSYALNRYGDRPLSEVLLPYGELALAHHLKSRIKSDVDRSFYQETRQRSYTDLNRVKERSSSRLSSFARSESYLKNYLAKAKDEKDLVNTLRALLGLGDLNLLSGRQNAAQNYYDLAWTGAQNLPIDHPIVTSFEGPVKLPSFSFSVVRLPVEMEGNFETIPVSVTIDETGRVKRVAREALIDVTTSKTNRARRIAKRARFRPAIENGKLIASDGFPYEVKISVLKTKTDAAVDDNAAE